ncbi:carbohydrate sulfotransferase 4-like [Montipora foliosa]|uniref:carbohydrate sulfotransferase 4-like n=1 Tax=Montipora foliosa TaxID=591990 RepID=UPI0035F125C7
MTFRRMRRTTLLRYLLLLFLLQAISLICVYLMSAKTLPKVNAWPQIRPVEGQHDQGDLKELRATNENGKRSLIIVSHGRSGSSLMGDIFNHHPSVFYMYEPFQTVDRVIRRRRSGIDEVNHWDLAKEFLNGVLRCKFENQLFLNDIEIYYRKQKHPRVSKAIASPPLCPYEPSDTRWDPKLCPPMTSQSLGSACKTYNLTVLKVLQSRIPENNIKIILDACSRPEVDCKILFLVRDPRAVIPSSKALGFFKEAAGDFGKRGTRLYSYWRCKETEDNLEIIKRLPDSLRRQIKLQRYEDLAFDPLKALSILYKFAGLNELESVREWLNVTTRQTRNDCNEMDGEQATCTKDDAWVAANRWRWKVHPQEINIIEKYCKEAMRLLGYTAVDNSYELLMNQSIPLFSQDYEAKNGFLH